MPLDSGSQAINHDPRVLPNCLYHGTSTGYLPQILRDGLCPLASADEYICFTDDPDIAIHHAECMASWDTGRLQKDCDPVLFKITIDRFNVAEFCLDENFITLAPSAGRAVGVDLRGLGLDWNGLLMVAGAVGYRSILKVSEDDLIEIPSLKSAF